MTHAAPRRTVVCPTCGATAEWSPDNPWRPFCSERCKQIDLGAWAAERYAIPEAEPDLDERLSGYEKWG